MRDILFRGKRIDDGEWVYGYILADTADCSIKREGKCQCKHDGSNCYILYWRDECHEYEEIQVDSSTVGQFSGLIDNTGKRIFEGDIVHCFYGYDDDDGSWVAELETTMCDITDGCCVDIADADHKEVSGNIYELDTEKENYK